MIRRQPVTVALAAMLASATSLQVGRGRQPANAAQHYYILYSLDTTTGGPPLADDNDDISLVYQLTSVSGPDPAKPGSSGSVDQVEWMADKARETFLGRDPVTGLWLRTLTVPGAKNTCREIDTEPGATNDPADAIISYVQRFRFDLTPA